MFVFYIKMFHNLITGCDLLIKTSQIYKKKYLYLFLLNYFFIKTGKC